MPERLGAGNRFSPAPLGGLSARPSLPNLTLLGALVVAVAWATPAHAQVCEDLPTAECDSGGADSATCDADCSLAECGAGTLNAVAGETCDDYAQADGDGCTADCQLETGWACSTDPEDASFLGCAEIPADGLITGDEECDDGAAASGDGCTDSLVEEGWACDGAEPSTCTPICGNGRRHGPEVCDDGNGQAGDGCAACLVEAGWVCDDVSPSACLADSDQDGVPDVDDPCPTTPGLTCEDVPITFSGGGACATAGSGGSGLGAALALALLALLIPTWRRR